MIDSSTGKLVRAGTQNRIQEINFNNFKFRDWEYQNPKTNKNIIIAGNFKKKVVSPQKKEKIYNNIKIFPQPNTKRTLLPEYAPVVSIKPSKKQINVKSSFSKEEDINTNNVKPKIKISNTFKESNPSLSPMKTHYRNTKFKDYKITQITTLPGALTRDINNINDDKNNIKKVREVKNQNINYINKLKNDYCSQISCLPNSLMNNDTKKIIRGKSYNKFNYKNRIYTNEDNNLVNSGGKKRIRREKNNEGKKRPFSSNIYNYNSNNNIIIRNNNYLMLYKNEESYETFDMLRPSCVFDKKYEPRVKIL